jgi:hypothetical protein
MPLQLPCSLDASSPASRRISLRLSRSRALLCLCVSAAVYRAFPRCCSTAHAQLPCTSSPVADARPTSASVPAQEHRHAAVVSLCLWPLAPARRSLELAVARSAAVLRTPVPRARLVPLGAVRLRAACLGPPAHRLPRVHPVPSARRLCHACARRRPASACPNTRSPGPAPAAARASSSRSRYLLGRARAPPAALCAARPEPRTARGRCCLCAPPPAACTSGEKREGGKKRFC